MSSESHLILTEISDNKWHENLGRDEDCAQGPRCQKYNVGQVGTGVD